MVRANLLKLVSVKIESQIAGRYSLELVGLKSLGGLILGLDIVSGKLLCRLS